ncbi:TlpA disulfide reductase family protein [Marinoscillum sp. MHG1-6]|uniref:TlpA family protein disulfide reductase n=1 Tax=Marinoscillum sp. MHG1-6 TaxID=2959627 RepID=UPI002157B7BF|nr:TlpA disulfide reductase family protein [Marinoscillum sp. MHG1-6]
MSRKSGKRELIEWVILIAVAGTLYFTGYHTEVIGFVQRLVLSTGIIKPDTEPDASTQANYNFELVNAAGRVVAFEEFKGKTVFINFWATWCPPCVAEMPDIHDLYEKTGDQVAFVMISLDDDRNKALRYIQNKEFDFPVYFVNGYLPQVYESSSIPSTYVISSKGNIVTKREGMAKYDTESFREFLLKL